MIKFVKLYSADLLPEKIIKIESTSSFLEYWYWDLENIFENRNIEFDKYGFVLFDYGEVIGKRITPTYVATVALYYLQKYLKSKQKRFLSCYKDQIGYIKNRYLDLGDRGLVWVFDFDWIEGKGILKAPWFSAMSQGLIISVLVRDYFIFGNEDSLKIAKKATKIFEFDVPLGVRYIENGYHLYEEYPILPPVHILDGFIFSLLGLYELTIFCQEEDYKRLFFKGINGLKFKLPYYDYKNKWSIFGGHNYLSSKHYNLLNTKLLEIIFNITNDIDFLRYSKYWDPYNKGIFDRIEINFIMINGIKVR